MALDFVYRRIYTIFSSRIKHIQCKKSSSLVDISYFNKTKGLSGNQFFNKNSSKGRYTYDVHENCLIFKIPTPLPFKVQNFSTHLTLDVQCQTKLSPSTVSNKLWNSNRTVHVNEWIQNKSKPSHVTFKFTTRSIVRFSPQTMQWYH